MLAETRRRNLLDLIARQGFATLDELVKALGVSESTVRRDLEALDLGGQVKRTHGGAVYFLFQAEDGIRDADVTGVQTCALPICIGDSSTNIITPLMPYFGVVVAFMQNHDKSAGMGTLTAMMLPYSLCFLFAWSLLLQIGRASCRERV